MSLVITMWDKSIGIAVSDGRAVTVTNGTKIPAREDHSKISRLPDGSVLGLTGGLRDGAVTSLSGVITEPLRREIHAASAGHTFRELCERIPRLLAEYRVKYPELTFGVSLLGNDNGTIRGAAYTSDTAAPWDESDIGSNVLGLSADANTEAAKLVREYTASRLPRNYVHLTDAYSALKRIVTDVSRRHIELNDRIFCEVIAAPGERTALDMPLLADGSQLTTAGVLTAQPVTLSTGLVCTTAWQALPGLTFSQTAQSAGDVFNVMATLGIRNASGTITYNPQVALYVDGASVLTLTFTVAANMTLYIPFQAFGITGLSAGTHTFQFYALADTGTYVEFLQGQSRANLQRIF